MASAEPFEFIPMPQSASSTSIFSAFEKVHSGKRVSIDVPMYARLRSEHPDKTITSLPTRNINLLNYAQAGFATATLDTASEVVVRWRQFVAATSPGTEHGQLVEDVFFAKYDYHWAGEDFVIYLVVEPTGSMQYVIKEPRGTEQPGGYSAVTDSLIVATGEWLLRQRAALKFIYVFDISWQMNYDMYDEVMKTTWDKVILDEGMKRDLTEITTNFFDSKETYSQFGVPWKRGLIFHGPPGNGKTITTKALMHTMHDHTPKIPCLYVKNVPTLYAMRLVFTMARSVAPCLLIFEDIETIVTPVTRSYFFNEVDGLSNNDGILIVASTNYLERLDPGLAKRPSRFDRKYLFPAPNKAERILYIQYWRKRVSANPKIDFPEQLVEPIAGITDDFSFAYIQEAFVATLLQLVREVSVNNGSRFRQADDRGTDADDADDAGDEDLDSYRLWVVIKEQIQILRDQMGQGLQQQGPCRMVMPAERKDANDMRQARHGLQTGCGSAGLGEDPFGEFAEGQQQQATKRAGGSSGASGTRGLANAHAIAPPPSVGGLDEAAEVAQAGLRNVRHAGIARPDSVGERVGEVVVGWPAHELQGMPRFGVEQLDMTALSGQLADWQAW